MVFREPGDIKLCVMTLFRLLNSFMKVESEEGHSADNHQDYLPLQVQTDKVEVVLR